MNRIIGCVPPDYKTTSLCINRLCQKYPFVSNFDVGKSVLGRRIIGLKIGCCEDCVLFAGAFHAQEWLTSLLLLRFTELLCEALDCGGYIADVDCRKAFLGRGLIIVPTVNPDGVEIALGGSGAALDLENEVLRISSGDLSLWNANARGVDLNHNFNAGWHILRQLEISSGTDGPSPRRYGGSAPESEPETQSMVALCEKYSFRHILAFHSQGEEIYWKYGSHTPSRSALMANVLAASSGYSLASPEEIASHGGFKDWFIEHFGRPGFTIEIGKGQNPLPIETLDDTLQRLNEMMMLAIVM